MSPLIDQLVTHKPTPAMTELAERLLTEPYYSDFLQLYQPTVAHDAASFEALAGDARAAALSQFYTDLKALDPEACAELTLYRCGLALIGKPNFALTLEPVLTAWHQLSAQTSDLSTVIPGLRLHTYHSVAKALYRTVLEVLLRHEAEIMSADKDKIRAIIWDQDAGLWLVRFALAYVRLRHATPAEAWDITDRVGSLSLKDLCDSALTLCHDLIRCGIVPTEDGRYLYPLYWVIGA